MNWRYLSVLSATVALALAAAGCGSSSSSSSSSAGSGSSSTASGGGYSASNPLKIGFIYIGAQNDGGFNQGAESGRQLVQKTFGNTVQTTYKINVPTSPQATQVAQSLVAAGNKLIIMDSAGYQNYMLPVAKAHPEVQFAELETPTTLSNYTSFDFDMGSADYLVGMALAAASKTPVLGDVSSFPYPGNLTEINGLVLGAQAINPKATVKVTFINSFFDPPKEHQAASALVSAGVGALGTTQNDAAPGQVANGAGLPWTGDTLSNAVSYGPKTWLTNEVFGFGPLFVQLTKLALAHKPLPPLYWGDFPHHMAQISPWGPAYYKLVSPANQAKIAAVQRKIAAGSFVAFTGPLYDQSGKLRVPAGQRMTPTQTAAMPFGVKGLIGNLSTH